MVEKLPINWRIDDDKLHLEIDLGELENQDLRHNLLNNLTIKYLPNISQLARESNNIILQFQTNSPYQIYLKNNLLLEFSFDAQHNLIIHSPPYMLLSVMELRMLATYWDSAAPHCRIELPKATAWKIRTDLHTHLTSQIATNDLLEIAIAHNALYPIELLHLLEIDTDNLVRNQTASYYFAPAAGDGLLCEQKGQIVEAVALKDLSPPQLAKLRRAMQVGIDEIISFDELERRIYRFRNPLTKNPKLIAATILKIAENYASHGIEYAELSVTAALDPNWLEAAIAAIAQAESQFGVTLKLLAGLPRSLPPALILNNLKMLMFISQHPAIVGIDFLGYEMNKTRNFAWAASHFAHFVAGQKRGIDSLGNGWDFPDDLIIRVHAGENGKNPDNVFEVLNIAKQYDVRVRVGHATYSDEQNCINLATELAQKNLIIMEFNPDSNLSLNNIDGAADLPIKRWAAANIPFVIASDGAGIYQTDAAQLFNTGVFAELKAQELNLMMQTETNHINYQQNLSKQKTAAFAKHYSNDAAFIALMREMQAQQAKTSHNYDFNGKIPLLIAGASGNSWNRIDQATQTEIKIGIKQLVQTLNPEHVAFIMGRIKPEGIGKVLEDALSEHYQENPTSIRFDVISMLSGVQNIPLIASHINHIIPLHGELMSVPSQITALLKQHNGMAIYIGGSAFTRDFILCSGKLGIPFAVMADAAGASAEKARILPKQHIFNGADGMVNWVAQNINLSN